MVQELTRRETALRIVAGITSSGKLCALARGLLIDKIHQGRVYHTIRKAFHDDEWLHERVGEAIAKSALNAAPFQNSTALMLAKAA